MIAEYLEHALEFERMARVETDIALKGHLEKQASAYRRLATERAALLRMSPLPPAPKEDQN